jgi:predicted outer membrane repeat protein
VDEAIRRSLDWKSILKSQLQNYLDVIPLKAGTHPYHGLEEIFMNKKRSSFNRILCIAITSLTLIASCGGGGGGGGGGGTEPSVVIYVKSNAAGADDGTSWQNAFTDLQTALTATSSGHEIWVAAGTYKPTDVTDRSKSFALKQGVSLYGGFSGTETTRSGRNWNTNETILSGDIGIIGDINDNSYHVVVGANNAILDGFKIMMGYAGASAGPDNKGGGMYNDSCNPTISNCQFINNQAGYDGGGMYNYLCSPVITDCTFDNNYAKTKGAGISNFGYADDSFKPVITRCIFKNNIVGGIQGNGAGIYNCNSSPTITECTFRNNVTIDKISAGAGIYNDESNSSPIITRCDFDSNSSGLGGGGIRIGSAEVMIASCTFTKNSAEQGGAISCTSSSTVINCIFSENSSTQSGGAIYNTKDLRVINSTFSANSAKESGGAIFGGPAITNCILWGNIAPINHEIDPGTFNPTITNCCIQDGYTGTGTVSSIIEEDPLFTTIYSFSLHYSSPCIDKGLNSAIPSEISTDFAGNTRIVNGTVDMGAYEYQK